jgi:serine O-acetyltransferase
VFSYVKRDIRAAIERDPAAQSWVEILLCYSGLHCLIWHRVAHVLWNRRVRLLARLISTLNRFFTGIEIHPAAVIGPGLLIDHGTGVVVGETAEIGEEVTIYQGVTLGGTGKTKGKRHPTIGSRVVLGAGCKILGAITVGDGAVVGANAVVLKDVPPHCTAVGVPARLVACGGMRIKTELDHAGLPDPVAEALDAYRQRLQELGERVARLEGRGSPQPAGVGEEPRSGESR